MKRNKVVGALRIEKYENEFRAHHRVKKFNVRVKQSSVVAAPRAAF